MERIANLIRSQLRPGVFLPLLVAALATTWYGLSPSLERFAELSGGRRFVDMQPWLTPDALIAQARSYDAETVRYYVGWSLFDYAWPFLTFTTMLFIAAWLLRPLPTRWQSALPWLAAAAYATVLFDWAENAGFVAVIFSDSAEPRALAWLAVIAHRGKLLFNFVFNFAFLLVLLCAIMWRVTRPAPA